MARKRKLDATPVEEPEAGAGEGRAAAGLWGGSMLNLMKGELSEARAKLAGLAAGVSLGLVSVEIPTNQIDDDIGSDRMGEWADDAAFEDLQADIARRGQRTPVRVRPVEPGWKPDPGAPLNVGNARFVLQSGRRRLAACRALARPVLALITTPEGDTEIDDLEERFLENTVREKLTAFEELISIGVISGRLGDLSQKQVAERLRVSTADVSLGVACLELREAIPAAIDIATAPKRAYRELIPRLRRAENETAVPAKPKARPTRRTRRYSRFTTTIAHGPRGVSLTIRGFRGDADGLLVRLEALLAEVDQEG